MKLSRPIRARIVPDAIRHNYRQARAHAPQARTWAVVKADAYGHGQWRAVEALRGEADGFALLECENAVALREAGVTQPLLLLEGIFSARDVRAAVEHRVTSVIHCHEQLELFLRNMRPEVPVSLCLKLNTGMNRLGFLPQQLPQVLQQLQASSNVNRITLMSHFACADEAAGIEAQLACFNQATSGLPLQRSLANSAALIDYAAARGDWVRPGIMLYGSSPFADRSAAQLGLLPAMTLKSQLISVQNLNVGDAVGYGAGFVAERPMRIGTVACGYADGYPRHAPSGTPVLVEGARTRLLGRVSMDMLAVDLSDLPQANIGSPVTLWGEGLSVDEVARAAGTIGYELLCALAPRVPVIED